MTQRTIETATAVIIINNIITTPVTLQLRPSKGSNNLNVLKVQKNIFSAMKLIEPTLKLTTFQIKTINTSDKFLSSGTESMSKFKEIYKYPKSSQVYAFHKIESTVPLAVIKYGNRQ